MALLVFDKLIKAVLVLVLSINHMENLLWKIKPSPEEGEDIELASHLPSNNSSRWHEIPQNCLFELWHWCSYFPFHTERLWKCITYALRKLTPAKINYSQIKKEALAIIFIVKKFHIVIYSLRFTLLTDYKPLLSIFGSEKLQSILRIVFKNEL